MGDVAAVVSDAMGLSANLVLFIVLAALAGAVVMAVLRVATRIDDEVLTFAGKLSGLSLLVYLSGSFLGNQVVEFTAQIWSTRHFYY